jgi:hypothetical protein
MRLHLQKQPEQKWTGSVAQTVQCVLYRYEALSTNPNSTQKKKKKVENTSSNSSTLQGRTCRAYVMSHNCTCPPRQDTGCQNTRTRILLENLPLLMRSQSTKWWPKVQWRLITTQKHRCRNSFYFSDKLMQKTQYLSLVICSCPCAVFQS